MSAVKLAVHTWTTLALVFAVFLCFMYLSGVNITQYVSIESERDNILNKLLANVSPANYFHLHNIILLFIITFK